MPIRSHITDPRNSDKAFVDASEGEDNALIVATRPLKVFENRSQFFTNRTYGTEMAQNATFGGVPDNVHDGIDNVYWTATAISGTWTFDSAAQNHTPAGAKSVNATATINGSTAQFAKGVAVDLSGYVAITGWIYITAWTDTGTKGIGLVGWVVATGQVGTSVDLRNYINVGLLTTWQKFTIPLSSMSLAGQSIDALRVTTISVVPGGPPDYYLDDIQIEQTGSVLSYIVEPRKGVWYHVSSVSLLMADAYAGTLADATMPNIAYNKWIGVASLSNGLIYQRVVESEVQFSFVAHNLFDWLTLPNSQLTGYGSDGTNTWIKVTTDLTEPVILKYETEDYLAIEISDDLSGLLSFKMSAAGKEETRFTNV